MKYKIGDKVICIEVLNDKPFGSGWALNRVFVIRMIEKSTERLGEFTLWGDTITEGLKVNSDYIGVYSNWVRLCNPLENAVINIKQEIGL